MLFEVFASFQILVEAYLFCHDTLDTIGYCFLKDLNVDSLQFFDVFFVAFFGFFVESSLFGVTLKFHTVEAD